jgi:exodeoxyribonuclease VII small subunit
MNFGENMERLDEILRQLEEGTLPVDEALKLFERGVTLVRKAREFLDEAEQKVTLLSQEAQESSKNEEVPFDRVRKNQHAGNMPETELKDNRSIY